MSTYHYLVIVHGMGESRYGETTLPVISRCAEVIHEVLDPDGKVVTPAGRYYEKMGRDIVTLGAFVGECPFEESERPWVEFQGIQAGDVDDKSFTGIPDHDIDGKLIRFVDIWWKDLVDLHTDVLEPASPWADGLIGRIQRMNADAPNWMPQLLFKLQDVLGPMQAILKTRVPDVEDLAFNKYLGDVQIYAEYKPMRGLAVRRFHERMEEVCRKHYALLSHLENPPPPQFTIIAHSLGTIMSLDALMFAHRETGKTQDAVDPVVNAPANIEAPANLSETPEQPRVAASTNPKINFSGYSRLNGDDPDTTWIKYVKTFVTLGSPIDKFLLFWPYRYQYLNRTDWIAKDLKDRQRIRHINYCDEQDPVGQSLDTLRSTKAYNELFTVSFEDEHHVRKKARSSAERMVRRVSKSLQKFMREKGLEGPGDKQNEFDVVYRRSVWPGFAHTSYWKDKDLFRNILQHVLKNKTGSLKAPNVVPHKRGMYIWITLLTYFVIPLAIVGLDTVVYDMLLEPESWKGYFTMAAIFVGAGWLSREVLNLLVWWRQLLRNKRSREVVPQTIPSIFVKWVVRLGMPLLAVGFSHVAIQTSGTHVENVKTHIEEARALAASGNGAATDWPELPEILQPFQLISGTTQNTLAFWTSLLSLFFLLVAYRTKSSNFIESSRYEAFLSIPVDVIVIIAGYWLLLTLWRGDTSKTLISGHIWQHPMGQVSLICLMLWHVYRFVKDIVSQQKKFLQKFEEIFLSFFVLIAGWFIVEMAANGIAATALSKMSSDALARTAYFSFIGVIVWVYMAFRFYVAKAQLGADKVPVFEEYYRG